MVWTHDIPTGRRKNIDGELRLYRYRDAGLLKFTRCKVFNRSST
jgi:hypothetical protein